eukprot:5145458-Amphidinium_carterae.1
MPANLCGGALALALHSHLWTLQMFSGDGIEVVDDGEAPEDFDNHFGCIEPSEHDEPHEGEDDEKEEVDDAIMDIGGLPKLLCEH